MKMTNERYLEYLERMKEASKLNPTDGHEVADDILCELLKELGYREIAKTFDDMVKFYG